MDQCPRAMLCLLFSVKFGSNGLENISIEIRSIKIHALKQPIHEYHTVDVPKHSEHCFCWSYCCPRSRGLFLRHQSKSKLDSCLNKPSFRPLLQCPEIEFAIALIASWEWRVIFQLVFDEVLVLMCMTSIWNADFWTEVTLSTDTRP
jgi:hypothetical protein